jgi:hypothetical protein
MAKLNPFRGWECAEERLKTVTDPRHRRVMETLRDHLKAEANADFDLLLSTLAANPEYHFWVDGSGFGAGPKGLDAVRSHYEQLYVERRHLCEWEIERWVIDDHTVVTEGWFDQIFPGHVLVSRGIDIDDPDAVYVVRVRLLILWPFDDDAKLVGEDSYINGTMLTPENIRKLDADEIPDGFYATA